MKRHELLRHLRRLGRRGWSSKCRISGSWRFSHLEPQEDDTLMDELPASRAPA
jgi:hypothetical protein